MEDKLRILKMVEEGRITADQAVELLDALNGDGTGAADSRESASGEALAVNTAASAADNVSYENKMLRIVVDSPGGDKVNVQLPVKIIRQILKVTGKMPIQVPEMQNMDVEALTSVILECIDNETLGDIVDVSAADGTTVRIYIG